VASGGQEPEACDCGSGVWQRWCGKRERKAATVRAVLHGRKSSDDEGSAARQKSSDGKGNASMHGKYFEASDVHIFFFFFCNLQMFVYIAWIYQI